VHGFAHRFGQGWGVPFETKEAMTVQKKIGTTRVMAIGAALFVMAACGGDTEGTTPAQDTRSEATSPMPAEETGMTITEIVAGEDEFSTLLTAVEAAGLGETLSGEGPFTVFAPTDDAFAALPEETLSALLKPKNQEQLASILAYHVVPAEVKAADVTAGEVPTANGEPFTIAVDGDTVTITDGAGNEATVTATDIDASNGVIHVIDSVLLPPQAA
jgi:uncharacterized surface protein with fasciclin (FAS1) repeats